MLRQLAVHNVVLVERLELEFEPGLGVLTGETGAGKSILLDALGLALGSRADTGLVRAGQDGASVSAELDLERNHPVHDLLGEQEIAADPGEPLIIRRTLKSDGGSRAFIGGAAVPAGLLREVGALLVEIHGQHDERGLLNPRGHRALLDIYGRIDTRGAEAAWQKLRALDEALAAARAEADAAERDRDWLEHAVAELGRLAPEAGEEESLAALRASMQAGARLGDELVQVSALLQGSEGGAALLRQAARRLDRIAGEHPLLGEALAALDRAAIEAAEGEEALARAAEAMIFDPARLEEAESRLFEIRALARKHRVEADALPALHAELKQKLGAIEAGGERVAELESELVAARATYDAAAAALSEARKAAAA